MILSLLIHHYWTNVKIMNLWRNHHGHQATTTTQCERVQKDKYVESPCLKKKETLHIILRQAVYFVLYLLL